MILITHDRSLMELVADRLWLAADGTIAPFDGDMDDYAKFVIERAKQAGKAPTQVPRRPSRSPRPRRRPRPGPRSHPARPAAAPRPPRPPWPAPARPWPRSTRPSPTPTSSPRTWPRPPTSATSAKAAHQALEAAEAEWLTATEAYEAIRGDA